MFILLFSICNIVFSNLSFFYFIFSYSHVKNINMTFFLKKDGLLDIHVDK